MHDLECCELAMSWKSHTQNDEEGVRKEFQRTEKAKRRKESLENGAPMSIIDKCSILHGHGGAQINAWTFSAHNSFKEDNVAKITLQGKLGARAGMKDVFGLVSD